MLHINSLTYRIEGRLLLDAATVAIPEGHKVGLVGRNGTGKTTLLRLICGELTPDAGSISLPKRHRIGALAQEAPADDASLLDTVLAADRERMSLLAEAEHATDPHRIAEIQTRLADIQAHSAPARAAAILKGLGFDSDAQARPTRDFSGGWRMRVALAALLFSEPDILLLDEPTNYLDLEGTIWLEQFLKSYPYTVLLVSHDRDLLNRSVSHILHLENRRLTLYRGGYDVFERTRRLRLEQQMALKAKQEEARRHMQAFVDRFRSKASKARQAQSRLKALEKMQPIAAMMEDKVHPFIFPDPKPMPPPLIRLEEAAVGYTPEHPVLTGLNLRIDMDDRLALLGANGNGKSTFAKLLAGRLPVTSGRLLKSKKLTIGYFAQHQIDEMTPGRTPFEHVADLMPDATQAEVRARLGAFGFDFDRANTKVAFLSGGEKARLLLHLCTLQAPHVLILDEPTNHLDVDSREALIHALNAYAGCVILISHDRHLIETCTDRLYLVANGTITRFEGDLDAYRALLLAETKPRRGKDAHGQSPLRDSRGARQENRRAAAAQRARLAPLKRKIKDIETRLQTLENDLARIEAALAEPGLYTDTPERAAELGRERTRLVAAIERTEQDWLDASSLYEDAKAERLAP